MKLMEVKDYYKVLGLERTASAEEIKRTYLKLAKLYHPDRNPGDKDALDRFRDIVEAYKVLGDLDSRLRYSIQLNKRNKLPRDIHDRKTESKNK